MTSLSDSQNIDLTPGQADGSSTTLPPGSPIQACPHCEALFDITEREPLEMIECPGCSATIQIHGNVDHFQIVEEAGRGGMGVVYKAYDPSLERYIAIKLLRKDHSEDKKLVEQLEAEAAMTASITDPNVVRVYGTGSDRGRFYLAMELVDKGSLDDLIKLQGRVAERQVLEVGIQIARGLRAASQHELIHRDVKPGNILFADANTAKIVDFGLAIFMAQEEASRGEIWGTPYYVAPEKLDEQPEDFRSDMYSLGGTLFHALAGRPPFEAETASLVALKHLKSQPVSLQAFAPWVSNATAHIVNRMLHKDPDERYQSYDELIDNLAYALSELQRQGEMSHTRRRVVLETEDDQKTISWVVLGTLAAVVILLTCFFIFRPKGDTLVAGKTEPTKASASDNSGPAAQYASLKRELDALASREASASELLHSAAVDSKLSPTDRVWAQFLEGAAHLSNGHSMQARKAFDAVEPLASRIKDDKLAAFLRAQSALLSKTDPISAGDLKDVKKSSYESIAVLLAGLHNWHLGRVPEGALLLRDFRSANPTGTAAWINNLKPLATNYIEELTSFNMQVDQLKSASNPESRSAAASALRKLSGIHAMRVEEAIAPYAKELEAYQAEASKAPTSGLFRILNKNSGKLLEVESFRSNDGAKVVQWDQAGGLNQLWEITDAGDGLRTLRATHASLSLDVPRSSLEPGAQIQLWKSNTTSAQRFKLESAGDGYFKIRSECSGLLLAPHDASKDNAASIVQVADTPAASALWRFERAGERIDTAWHHFEVDPANSSGSAKFANGVFTLKNKSTDIWGKSDSFGIVCQHVSGDFEFVARIVEIGAAHEWSKAGLIARGSLSTDQRNVCVVASASRLISHQRRLQNNTDSTSVKVPDLPAPRWLKLIREGQKLTSYHSEDGTVWSEVSSDSFNPAPTHLVVGLCVTSHNAGAEVTAKFDNVKLTQRGKLEPSKEQATVSR